MPLPILGLIEGAKSIAGKIADAVQGKRELLAALAALETGILTQTLDYETKLNESRTSVIVAEAQSQSWLTRNWRPLTMIAFVVAILGYWFGFVPQEHLTEAVVLELFSLVKYGLTGYVVGRSAEKIVKSVGPEILGMKLRRKKDR